jgi:hypothetical protein
MAAAVIGTLAALLTVVFAWRALVAAGASHVFEQAIMARKIAGSGQTRRAGEPSAAERLSAAKARGLAPAF